MVPSSFTEGGEVKKYTLLDKDKKAVVYLQGSRARFTDKEYANKNGILHINFLVKSLITMYTQTC